VTRPVAPASRRRVTEWCLFCLREGRRVAGSKLCDGPPSAGAGGPGTCDKRMCAEHVGRHEVPDRDVCPDCCAAEARP
jgi:hypothetical protein